MLKKFFVAAIIFCVLTSIAQAAPKKSVWQPELLIGITSGVTQVGLKVSAPCIMIDAVTKKTIKKIPAEKNFAVDFAQMKTNAIEIRPEKVPLKDLQTTINGRKYFGGVRVNKVKGSLTVINIAPTEEYLRGVVGEEMSPSYPIEALKAQAVAARSFALKNRKKHNKEGFDLCPTTHCQIYAGVEDFSIINEAIDATRGEVLTFNEKIADTNFHADSGGMTESVANVWGTNAAYLVPVKEILQLTAPWTMKFSAKDFSSRFGDNFGDVTAIKLSKLTIGKSSSDRTDSGRVKSAQLVGTKKTLMVSGADLRRKFSLPSTLFDMKLDGGEVIFTGYGRGHGVGMSQQGAKTLAEKSWTYDKILAHYYSGTKLKKLY
ncbi:MAG: SpoIID/LytB domain-containing protein [Selenomonadaceae bacterium]|nr:SpoIID/LytB domain-containing protein [Selenomonadaceae bacterium]